MGKKFMFYPGCTLKGVAKNLEDSTIESAKVLGYDLEELPGWTCCGAVYGLAQDSVKFAIANVRNLIKAQNYGKEIGDNRLLAICAMCYNNLRRAHIDVMKNRDKLKILDLFMDVLGGRHFANKYELVKVFAKEVKKINIPFERRSPILLPDYRGKRVLARKTDLPVLE